MTRRRLFVNVLARLAELTQDNPMPRYFLHSFDASSSVFDDIGRELSDDKAALKHAIWCARDIVANALLGGYELDLKGYLSVQDLDGRECCRVCFRDLSRQLRFDGDADDDCRECAAPNEQSQPVGEASASASWQAARTAFVVGLAALVWAFILLVALIITGRYENHISSLLSFAGV